jgi:hypothetical protein
MTPEQIIRAMIFNNASDATVEAQANAYVTSLTTVAAYFRTYWPGLHMILPQANNQTLPYIATTYAGAQTFAAADGNTTIAFRTDDGTSSGTMLPTYDGAHLATVNLEIQGRNMAVLERNRIFSP